MLCSPKCCNFSIIYLSGDQSLPNTRFELFCQLVLCCIKRELQEKCKSVRALNDVSSLEKLPSYLSEQLHNQCVLAFEEVKQNKIVFSQKELPSFKLPKVLPTLGLQESFEGYDSVYSRQITYNFIHLAVQELLAAYYIYKMESDKHAEVLNLFWMSLAPQLYYSSILFSVSLAMKMYERTWHP